MMKFLTVAFANLTSSVFYSAFPQSLQDTFDQIFISNSQVGASVVTHCNAETKSYHYGLKNINSGEVVNDNTIYRIASISKTISAIGAMKLNENGQLNWMKISAPV